MTAVKFDLSAASGSCIIPILIALLLLSWTDSYPHHSLYRLAYSSGRCHQYDTHKINIATDAITTAVAALHVGSGYRHSKLMHVSAAAVTLIGSHDSLLPSAAIVSTTNITTTTTTSLPSNVAQQYSVHSLKVRVQWFQSHIRRNNIQSLISLFKHYRDEIDITYHHSIDEYYIDPDDISYALTRLLPSMNRGSISTFCEQVLFHRPSSMYHVLDTQALTATMSSLNK